MRIRRSIVTQNRVFQPDVISIGAVLSQPVSAKIQEAFGFQGIGTQQRGDSIIGAAFAVGAFVRAGVTYPVPQLTIEARRIEFQLEGSSTDSNRFFEELASLLADLLPDHPNLTTPIYIGESTTSIALLEFQMRKLLAPAFVSFLDEHVAPAVYRSDHRVAISPSRVAASVSWIAEPGAAVPLRLTDKQLVIERRTGTREEEQTFFVTTPTDSETHNRLLDQLDKLLTD